MRVAVVGAGAWGAAFAGLVAPTAEGTRLVCRTAAQAAALAARGAPAGVVPTSLGDGDALAGAGLVVLAVPSRATREAAEWLVPRLPAGAGVLSLTKGLDPPTGRRLSQAWGDVLPAGTPFAVLSGPNHAEEVAAGHPTAAVVAGDADLARSVQELLRPSRVRIYVNDDLAGVELCAAAKNVIALAAGMSDGFGFGDNVKAALITRGLAEMTRLGVACGARAGTFRGLAGMGDLVATCTSGHSRNRRAGELIARGASPGEVEHTLGQVAEGLWTVRNLLALADGAGVELPISAEVAAVVFEGRAVAQSLEALMARAPASEE